MEFISAGNAGYAKKSGGGSNAGGEGNKKKSGGGSNDEGDDNKKNGGISKAVLKKIDTWWETNSDALVKEAVEKYKWDEVVAKDTVKAYHQYLIVKREMKDWNNQLIPCERVITIMEQHEFNEDFDYHSDMKFLCGHDFAGEQLVVVGRDDDFDREKATFEAVRRRFGPEFNETLWNTLDVLMIIVNGGFKFNPKTSSEWGGEAVIVPVYKPARLESAFELIDQDDSKLILSAFQLLLLRTQEVIDPTSDTALGLGMVYTDLMLGLHKDETLIEVKKAVTGADSSSTRLFCAAGTKMTMSKALKDLVKDDEEDESKYVFKFKGKRIFGFETPMSLHMKHFDTIEAISVNEYVKDHKYQRCICCNNKDHNVEG